jgi:hypothetical protein
MSRLCWVSRLIAGCLVVVLTLGLDSAAEAQQAAPATAAPGSTTPASAPAQSGESSSAQSLQAYPDAPIAQDTPPGQQQQSNDEAKPLGTAAAPYTRPSGVTGSRPAGAVIAPAKQRRARTILISVGVIAAAGIAIGTVAGLSHGSPSRPLGAN